MSASSCMTGDRGLAGAYNTSVIRAAERQLMGHVSEGKGYSLCCVGRKSAGYFRFRNYRIDHGFSGFSDNPSYDDARRIAEAVTESFLSEAVDQVELIYTEFVSVGTQRVVVYGGSCPSSTPKMMVAGGLGHGQSRRQLRVRAVPRGGHGGLAAPLHRGTPLWRPARCGRVGARQSPAGHEGSHRQRRGADHQALAGP